MNRSLIAGRSLALATTWTVGALSLSLAACDAGPAPPAPQPAPPQAAAGPATQPAARAGSGGLTLPDGTHIVNTKCPASGEPLDPKAEELATFVHEGKTYGVCCAPCIEEAKADPSKLAQAE